MGGSERTRRVDRGIDIAMSDKFRVCEAHGVFWPQFRAETGHWLGYRSCAGATDKHFDTLQEAKDFITKYETPGEVIHKYP